jgi:hypothetical protein
MINVLKKQIFIEVQEHFQIIIFDEEDQIHNNYVQ